MVDRLGSSLAHLGVRLYGPKHLPITVTNLVYTPGYDHI